MQLLQKRPVVFTRVFSLLAIAGISICSVSAQSKIDSTQKITLAAATKKPAGTYIVREANIVFPDILKGNEAAATEYIQNFSTRRRDYLIRMYTKGKKVLPKVCTILKKYNLPQELKVLITLESAYNSNAVSKAGAVGYWQIMDAVAKEYGLQYVAQLDESEKKKLIKENAKKADSLFKAMAKLKDDRKNFNKSTAAAARYLRDRRLNLNDNWLLVVASYNCGVGNVWNAMQRSGKANPTFWDVKTYLPAETQAYVMNFIALNVIFHNYDKFVNNTLTFVPEKIWIPEGFETEPGIAPESLQDPVNFY